VEWNREFACLPTTTSDGQFAVIPGFGSARNERHQPELVEESIAVDGRLLTNNIRTGTRCWTSPFLGQWRRILDFRSWYCVTGRSRRGVTTLATALKSLDQRGHEDNHLLPRLKCSQAAGCGGDGRYVVFLCAGIEREGVGAGQVLCSLVRLPTQVSLPGVYPHQREGGVTRRSSQKLPSSFYFVTTGCYRAPLNLPEGTEMLCQVTTFSSSVELIARCNGDGSALRDPRKAVVRWRGRCFRSTISRLGGHPLTSLTKRRPSCKGRPFLRARASTPYRARH